MNKYCVFTICATNYVGLSKILGNSIRKYYNGADFYILVADEPNAEVKRTFDSNILVGKDVLGIDERKWYEMAFKYDLTEFCTSIKPHSFSYFFSQGYEKCIYFDPDILAFASIEPVFDSLDNYLAIVTPHILQAEENYTGELKERHFLQSGVFNFGFLALKNTNSVNDVLRWWEKRLEDACYSSKYEPFFTDQKWGNMLPCFLRDKLCVSSNMGMNVASWNFHERRIIFENETLYVSSRITGKGKDKLIFVHFSGYKYKDLLSGNISRIDTYNYGQYKDIGVLFEKYAQALKEGDFNEYIDNAYTYNYFEDSNYEVNPIIRRLYRAYSEVYEYQENPFSFDSYLFKSGVRKGIIKKKSEFKNLKLIDVKGNVGKKLTYVNKLLYLIFMVLGSNRYFNFIKLFGIYFQRENHSFLIKKRKDMYKLYESKI